MAYLVLGVALVAGLLLLARGLASANPVVLAWFVRVALGLILTAVPVFLAVTGKLHILFYALPFALPFYFHWRSSRIRQRNAQGPSSGTTSSVDTGWLRMELDHDSGTMRGIVQRGRFAGRDLGGMNLEELLALHDEVGADPDSVRVLEAYLDRTHGSDWREGAAGAGSGTGGAGSGGRSGAGTGSMSEDEALEILGLSRGAGPGEIKEAHRRLMAKMHPDRGGSTYLAAQLNRAKDVLMKGR